MKHDMRDPWLLRAADRLTTPGRVTAQGWRLRDHPLHIAAAGVVIVVLAAVLYWVPGIILVGSISQVRGLCNSGAGVFAQGASPDTASSCARAEDWTGYLAVAAVIGIAMAAAGAFLASRSRPSGS